MDKYNPFDKLSDLYDSIVNWQSDPLIKPDNQNKYLFSDGKTYYEQLCKILKLLSTFKDGFNQIYENLDELEEQIQQTGVTQEDLQNAINNLHTVITGEIALVESSLSSDISDLDTEVTSLSGRMTSAESNISTLQTLTATHTTDIATINTAITSIQESLLTKISDAPQDGKTYGRKNGAWNEVTGGGGGTSDYDALDNKPQINGNTLSGNKTGAQMGLVDASALNEYIESDSLLNQEFIYRQSQAKHDGLLNIDKIKGNTIVWNQLVNTTTTSITLTNNHIYIINIDSTLTRVVGTGQSISVMGTDNVFDLTLMFGSGNEPTSVSDFTDLFQLPYYNYNVGSLLSFNGTGLKTENSTQSENNTLSLPISTYFPTGMKSVGTVYDELTSSKAITRIGSVDLGSLTWSISQGVTPQRFEATMPSNYKNPTSIDEINRLVCSKYIASRDVTLSTNTTCIGNYANMNLIFARDLSYNSLSDFQNAMSGVILYYEVETPTEQDIDIDLTTSIWNDGTEEILPINTSTPTTSPIICDMEYMGINDEILSLYNSISEIISDMLTKIDASSLYQTISGMSAYLSKLDAQTLYQVILQSGVNIKTINNQSLLGSGNIATATQGQITTINNRLDDIDDEIVGINSNLGGINRTLPLKMDTDTANASFMPINRIASASQLGGIKVGANLSIDADGTLNAQSGSAVFGAWQTVNITASTSTGNAPTWSAADIKVKYDSTKKNLLFNGRFTAKGSGNTAETIITTDLTVTNNSGSEISINNIVVRDNYKARLIIDTNGLVKFGVFGSVSNSDYGILPIPINLDNFV